MKSNKLGARTNETIKTPEIIFFDRFLPSKPNSPKKYKFLLYEPSNAEIKIKNNDTEYALVHARALEPYPELSLEKEDECQIYFAVNSWIKAVKRIRKKMPKDNQNLIVQFRRPSLHDFRIDHFQEIKANDLATDLARNLANDLDYNLANDLEPDLGDLP